MQAFRPSETLTVKTSFRGLNSQQRYVIEADGGKDTGAELMRGFNITLREKPAAAVLYIEGRQKKPILTLLPPFLLAPLAAFAQAKPEVANAAKAAKRAWESAPAEKKALWLQQREALTHIDISDDPKRQVVIARGARSRAGITRIPPRRCWRTTKRSCASGTWARRPRGADRAPRQQAVSLWTRIDDALPSNYVNFRNCPSIYRPSTLGG